MLPIPNLNEKNKEMLFEEALQKLKIYGKQIWTDFDIHDPGITILEALCYLKEKQQQSMETIDNKTLLQLAKLLYLNRQGPQPAKTLVEIKVEKNIFLPKRTKFLAGNYIYENDQRTFLQNNNIIGFGIGEHFLYWEETQKNVTLFEDEKELLFYFEKPLVQNQIISIYITLQNQNRNIITDKEDFLPLSSLEWEYYGEEKGEVKWHPIEIIEDRTEGFLFSGFVFFQFHGISKKWKNGFPLRIRVKKYGYEIPPVLQSAQINVLELFQKETKVSTISFTKKEFLQNKMIFDHYLAFEQCFILLFRTEQGFIDTKESDIVFLVKELKENMLFQLGTSHREKLKEAFAFLKEGEIVFKLICFEKQYFENAYQSADKGTANQKLFFHIEEKDCIEEYFSIFVKSRDKTGIYWKQWERVPFLEERDKKQQCYTLEENMVTFGDNMHGKVPSRIAKNVLVNSLEVTCGEKGCVQKGVIEFLQKPELFDTNMKVIQFRQAVGGKKAENLQQLSQRMEMVIAENDKRAVTAEEYQKMVLSCQGLCVKKATILPLYRPYMKQNKIAENTLTIVVEPPLQPKKKQILTSYLENIQRQLQKRKLLTTQIFVMLPEYIPLDIYGDFVVQYTVFSVTEAIESTLEDYLEQLQKKENGNMLYYGDFFAVLEGLEYMKEISYLKLELAGCKSNSFGDSSIPPYGRVYLRNCYLNIIYQ